MVTRFWKAVNSRSQAFLSPCSLSEFFWVQSRGFFRFYSLMSGTAGIFLSRGPHNITQYGNHSNCDYDLRFDHFDRRATKWPEVEKSNKKDFPSGLSLRFVSRLCFAALELTGRENVGSRPFCRPSGKYCRRSIRSRHGQVRTIIIRHFPAQKEDNRETTDRHFWLSVILQGVFHRHYTLVEWIDFFTEYYICFRKYVLFKGYKMPLTADFWTNLAGWTKKHHISEDFSWHNYT